MDSFLPETFERIRCGAKFEVVFRNLQRLLELYETPRRIFSVGSVVMKSNLRELPDNLRFAIEHDIGVNFGPLVIYPVHERLDVFEHFAEEAADWEEVLDEARSVAQDGLRRGCKAFQRINPVGMIEAIADIVRQAREQYQQTLDLTVHVSDPHQTIPTMRCPILLITDGVLGAQISYVRIPQPGIYTIRLPIPKLNGSQFVHCWFLPDAHDELRVVDTKKIYLERITQSASPEVVIRLPRYEAPPVLRNIEAAREMQRIPLRVVPPKEYSNRRYVGKRDLRHYLLRGIQRVGQLLGLEE